MKLKRNILAALLCITASLHLFGCSTTKTAKTEHIHTEAEPLVIDIQEPCTSGDLTIRDPQGNTYFQYTGAINIVNNGRNGEPIDISVTLPGTEGVGTDTIYSLPIPVVLYNKNTKTVEQYLCYPEFENGTLKLMDSELTYIERDIEWEERD